MEKLTRKDVEMACENLKAALIAMIELDEKDEKIQLLKIRARKSLLMARDDVYSLRV